jgi:hypothetical protein
MGQGKKQMKKKMIKRVTIEYFEEFLSYAEDYDMPGIVPDTKKNHQGRNDNRKLV